MFSKVKMQCNLLMKQNPKENKTYYHSSVSSYTNKQRCTETQVLVKLITTMTWDKIGSLF